MKTPELGYALSSFHPALLEAAQRTSAFLAEREVPHAMCGGLAVGAYGVADFEPDVEFIVGDEAFVSIDGLRVVKDGLPIACGDVPVSVQWLDKRLHTLRSALCEPFVTDDVHVLAPEALIALRLARPRRQHLRDIAALIANGSVNPAECRGWLATRGFDIALFDHVVSSLSERSRAVGGAGA